MPRCSSSSTGSPSMGAYPFGSYAAEATSSRFLIRGHRTPSERSATRDPLGYVSFRAVKKAGTYLPASARPFKEDREGGVDRIARKFGRLTAGENRIRTLGPREENYAH